MADDKRPTRPEANEHVAWSALSALLSGMIAWGLIGWLLDKWLHIPMQLGLLFGLILGTVTGVYVVIKRLG